MRCDDVIRELRDDARCGDEAALAEHLAGCDRCAAIAARGQGLRDLWDATRPAEPGQEAWDRVWAGVQAGLESSALRPAGARLPGQPGPAPLRRWRPLVAVGLVGLAQAAALVLAIGPFWSGPARRPDPAPPAPATAVAARPEPSLDSVFDIEDGQVALIRSEGKRVVMIDLTALDTANGEDPWFVFFNRVEAASTVVAMRSE